MSKVEDREYILPRVRAAGGFDGINARVKRALRDWLAVDETDYGYIDAIHAGSKLEEAYADHMNTLFFYLSFSTDLDRIRVDWLDWPCVGLMLAWGVTMSDAM